MATASELMNLGINPEAAGKIAEGVSDAATGLTAAGTTIADALQLTKSRSVVSTAAAATGVKLPAFGIGAEVFVQNDGANVLNVYPSTSSQKINGGSDGAAITLGAGKGISLVKTSGTNWQSQAVNKAATGLTAAGTTIADALALTADFNVIGTAAASTGVKLPSSAVGALAFVKNGGANTVNIWPNTASEKINGGTAGAAVTLATTKSALLLKVGAIDWVSVGLD